MFASGQSNGGGFTNVMACDPGLSKRFAAFGPHSAANYVNTTAANCQETTPYTELTNTLVQPVCSPGRLNVPYQEIHGDADTQIAYFGGSHRGYCMPAIPHHLTDWYVKSCLSLLSVNIFPGRFEMATQRITSLLKSQGATPRNTNLELRMA